MIPLCRLILVSVWTVESVVALIWAGAVAGIKEMFPPNIIHQAGTARPQLNHIWSNFSITGNCEPALPGLVWLLQGVSALTPVTPWENRWTGGRELKWHILNPNTQAFPGIGFLLSALIRMTWQESDTALCQLGEGWAVYYWDQDMSRAAPGNKTYFLPLSLKTQSQLSR